MIGDDPILQCFCANRYLNEQFSTQLTERPPNVAPLTVMLIDELEAALPYFSSGDLGWRDVFDSRFAADGVSPDSFHTSLATIRTKKKIAHRRNEYLSEQGERIRKLIFERYHFGQTQSK